LEESKKMFRSYFKTSAKKLIPFLTKSHESLKAVSAKRPEIFMYGFFILLFLSFSQEARMNARIDAVKNEIPDIASAKYDDGELRALISGVDLKITGVDSAVSDLKLKINGMETRVLKIDELKDEVDEVQSKLGIFDLD
jgi:hypothetical protein